MTKCIAPGVGVDHLEKIGIPFTGLNGNDGQALGEQREGYRLVAVEDIFLPQPRDAFLFLTFQLANRENGIDVNNAQGKAASWRR